GSQGLFLLMRTPRPRQPPIVRCHKTPTLDRPSDLYRILLDILDRPLDVLDTVEIHFPPRPTPHGMIHGSLTNGIQLISTRRLERFDHVLRMIPMFPNQRMHVVRHDRTGVARVVASENRFFE